MKGAARGAPPGSRITISSAKGLLGAPADVGAYLQYARENVDRSKLLFQRGDLRYSVFSANEGLELCVKAYLLHYKAIANPVVTRHFPHPFLVQSIRKNLKLFGKQCPDNADLVRQLTSKLDKLDALFEKLDSHKTRVALWKKSLGVDLGGGDQKLLDQLGPLVTEWSGPGSQVRAGFRRGMTNGGPAGFLPAGQGVLRSPLLALFHQKFERNAPQTVSLPGNGEVQLAEALRFGQLIALTELFLHTTAIVNGFVHQQTSRYPTQIDGVDSAEVYARHRDGVAGLLGRIYSACEMLMPHLDSRSPPPPPPPLPDGCPPP